MDAVAGKLKDMSDADKKNLFLYHVNQPSRPVPSGESHNMTLTEGGARQAAATTYLSELDQRRRCPPTNHRPSFLFLTVCHLRLCCIVCAVHRLQDW